MTTQCSTRVSVASPAWGDTRGFAVSSTQIATSDPPLCDVPKQWPGTDEGFAAVARLTGLNRRERSSALSDGDSDDLLTGA